MRQYRGALTLAAAFVAAYIAIYLVLGAGGPGWLAALMGAFGCWGVFATSEREYIRQRAREVHGRFTITGASPALVETMAYELHRLTRANAPGR